MLVEGFRSNTADTLYCSRIYVKRYTASDNDVKVKSLIFSGGSK